MKTRCENDGIASLRVLLAISALALVMALMSCASGARRPTHEVEGHVIVEDLKSREEPPSERSEVFGDTPPSPNYVRVGGYWMRHADRWQWMYGRWELRPNPDSVWMDGRWDREPGGYVRVQGHWRPSKKSEVMQ